jgi:hypothetical protein
MFSLFKKKTQKENNTADFNFQNLFTEEQKAAIAYSLMLMVGSEGDYDENKLNYLAKQAELLNIDLDGKSMAVYKTKKADYAYSIIKSLSANQKDIYSVMLGNIMLVNGKPTENEMRLANRILTECEISEEQFKNANLKTQVLWNKFNL